MFQVAMAQDQDLPYVPEGTSENSIPQESVQMEKSDDMAEPPSNNSRSNRANNPKNLRVIWKTHEARFTVQGSSAATLKWAIF